MSAVFVAGTGTDVCKTFVTAGLLRHLRGRGIDARALKPVASGFDPAQAAASDPGVLLASMGEPATPDSIAGMSPFRFAAPLAPDIAARREGKVLRLDDIIAFCRARLLAASGPLLIEGVGGVMSPLAEGATGIELQRALGIPAVLVAGSYLGTISHVLTAARALAGEGIDLLAIALNESAGAHPDLAETAAELGVFLPRAPVVTLRRDAAPAGEAFAELARACRLAS